MTDQPNTNTISVEEQAEKLRALVVNVMNDRLPAWWEPMGSFLFDEDGRLYEIAVLPKGELERLREDADHYGEQILLAREKMAEANELREKFARQAVLIDAIDDNAVFTDEELDTFTRLDLTGIIQSVRSLIAAHKKSTEVGSTYTITVKEDHGDTLYLSCSCGTIFVSDAFGENTVSFAGVNVPQCPTCHTMLGAED